MFHAAQATDYIDLLVQLEDLASNDHVDSIAINAAGSGYVVGDLFDINGGTVVNGLNATGEVLTVGGGGAVTSIRLYNGGAYTANPGIGATTSAITGVGIGLTVDTTTLFTGWTVNRSQVYDSPERELIMNGSGSGSDEIYIGIQTKRNTVAGVFYWELAGLTGFNNALDFDLQPGSTRQLATVNDLTTPLNNGIIDYFFVIDTFHIKGVAKSGSSFPNFYMGFINTFATASEYVYPLCIIGASADNQRTIAYNSSDAFYSGMDDPLSNISSFSTDGPGAIRENDGNWYMLHNGSPGSGSSKNHADGPCIWPRRELTITGMAPFEIDRYDGASYLLSILPRTFFGGATDTPPPDSLLIPTDDPGPDGFVLFLWPTIMYQALPSIAFLGELIDVHPVSVVGTPIVNEDTVTLPNGDTYILFQNCARSDGFTYFAMKRNF